MTTHPRFVIKKSTLAGSIVVALLVAASIARVHLRAEATLLGYEIGELKDLESQLLDERSYLNMELAKLTTRKHLALMAERIGGGDSSSGDSEPRVAFNQ